MASSEVYSAIRAHLAANWSATTVAYENEQFDPPSPLAPWVAVEVFGEAYARASIGAGADDRWDESGSLLMHVFVPAGTGSTTARAHTARRSPISSAARGSWMTISNSSTPRSAWARSATTRARPSVSACRWTGGGLRRERGPNQQEDGGPSRGEGTDRARFCRDLGKPRGQDDYQGVQRMREQLD